ncbi:MAG TPA: beta-carotene hydroxylase, partial [Franconibacter helveticus]|nr:beta-carotene hydroxylase [Franconibacter helveticus]
NGVFYFLVHDGLVHRRWAFNYIPRRGYLKRLYQAHRLHHAVNGKEGCVSFGFLYAAKPEALKAELRRRHGRKPKADAATARQGGEPAAKSASPAQDRPTTPAE